MKQVLIFIPKNFEDTELTAVADILQRNQITYDFVSIHNKTREKALNFVEIQTKPIDSTDTSDYASIFLPGGAIRDQYLDNEKVVKTIKNFYEDKKWLFAICAGPDTYFRLGLLDNVQYAAFPNFAVGPNKIDQQVVVDQNFITARDYKASIKLGEEIVRALKKN